MLDTGTGELPGEGRKLEGWRKQKASGPDFSPKALEANWGFSISLTLQGVIPSMQHQPHELSLTLSQSTACTTAPLDRKAILY